MTTTAVGGSAASAVDTLLRTTVCFLTVRYHNQRRHRHHHHRHYSHRYSAIHTFVHISFLRYYVLYVQQQQQ